MATRSLPERTADDTDVVVESVERQCGRIREPRLCEPKCRYLRRRSGGAPGRG